MYCKCQMCIKNNNVGLFMTWIILYCKCFDKHAILETSVTFGKGKKGRGGCRHRFFRIRSCVVTTFFFAFLFFLEKHDMACNKVGSL